MNIELKKTTKNDFGKYIFKLMNNIAFQKVIKDLRNLRDIKLVTTEERRSYLRFEPSYQTTKNVSDDLLPLEIKRTQIIMDKHDYLGMSI